MNFLTSMPAWQGVLLIAIGIILGYFLRLFLTKKKLSGAVTRAEKATTEAKQQAKEIIIAAKNEALNVKGEAVKEEKDRLEGLRKIEEKIFKREEQLEIKINATQKKEEELHKEIEKVKEIKQKIENLKIEEVKKIEVIASLTKEEAKNQLFAAIEIEEKENLANRLKKLVKENMSEIEKKTKELMTYTMQRFASSQASEISTSTINLPSEEIKGKIIGKEGRNIRTFEKMTGVSLIVDDTPGAIILSCFDPVRRFVAKLALEKLMSDGRIQPARIEEVVQNANEDVEKEIQKRGEEALYELGISGIDPKLIHLLGRLHFRTSYGQNVLSHSVEMAHIAGMLATELGADIKITKIGALFHDIGKAVDHEIQGTHVEIGRKILNKFGTDERIIKAMQSHHEEYPYETLESVIVQVADALSASRPGARRGTLEAYLKRLEDLEQIANSFEGVEKSFAISAGREIRIFVKPEIIDDIKALSLAKAIANKVESELKYPGEIKINVIRETRAVEYAK